MNGAANLDVSALPVGVTDRRAPLWAGQAIMCVIEGTLFVILFVVYMYLRSKFDIWPPAGTYQPIGQATVALVLLLLSCVPMYLGDEQLKKGNRIAAAIGEAVGLLFGVGFFVFQVLAWKGLDYKWNSNVYGSIVYSILGLHIFDFCALFLETLVFVIILLVGRIGVKQRLGVRCDALTWYFIVGIWIPGYLLVYVYPWILQRASQS